MVTTNASHIGLAFLRARADNYFEVGWRLNPLADCPVASSLLARGANCFGVSGGNRTRVLPLLGASSTIELLTPHRNNGRRFYAAGTT
jgi:hypothetical protein